MRRRCYIFYLVLSFVLAVLPSMLGEAQEGNQSVAVVQLLHDGRDAVQRGDLAGAEILFRRAVENAPMLSDCYLGLGLVELRRGEIDEAAKSLAHGTELNPLLPGAHLFLGIAQYQMGSGEQAAKSLQTEITLQPNNTEALTWLGIVELGLSHPEDAIGPLDQAAMLAPKNENILYYKARAHHLVAEAAYKDLYQLDPDSVLVHRALGDTLANSGQPEKAIAEYEAAIKKQPNNPDLYESLGEQNQKISRVNAAIDAYEEELRFNANSAIALYNLGKIRVERGEPAVGVALLRRAEAAHAAAAPTDFYLGFGLVELGQNEEAAHWLEQSIASSPSPFIEQSATYQLARAYQKLNRKADAQHALDRLKELKAVSAKNITGGSEDPVKEMPEAATPSASADGSTHP
jgi:tetratricopeptide (TPR) repeat protein